MHGKTFTQDTIRFYLEAILETYNYETPETILLFLKKASNGDYGKFFGPPDIGTIREWFTDFLESDIIPARERRNEVNNAGGSRERNRATKGIEPIKQIYTKTVSEGEHKGGKKRTL